MNKSILDPTFNYVPSNKTDIRQTFERIRQEQAATASAVSKVRQLNNRKSKTN